MLDVEITRWEYKTVKKKSQESLKWIPFLIDLKQLQLLFPWKLTFMMVFGPCVCLCVCLLMCLLPRCVCVSCICLALILAAIRTMPCIRKHAGVGLESRSGLENNVGILLRPDFLLSLAMCCSTCPPRTEPGVTHHAYLGTHAWKVLACLFCWRDYMVFWHKREACFNLP